MIVIINYKCVSFNLFVIKLYVCILCYIYEKILVWLNKLIG